MEYSKEVKQYNKYLSVLLAFLIATSSAFGWTQATAPVTTKALTATERKLVESINVEGIKQTVNALAAPEMLGRGTAQPGGDKAAAYLADRFAQLGPQPRGDRNTYLQAIKFRETQFLPQTAFSFGDQPLKFGTDYFVAPPLTGDKTINAKMYFVGYGTAFPFLQRNDLGDT